MSAMPQTIGDVIAELDGVISWARTRGHRAGYFAVLYRSVTDHVRRAIQEGRFDDGARMERFDVVFARRYLRAFDQYRQGASPGRSWGVAFEASETWSPIVLQHLLLGINAHINLDLGVAAAQTSPGAELPALEGDFNRIMDILRGMIDDVQDRIDRVSPWMGVLDWVGGRSDEALMGFVIEKARAFAWRCAQQLAVEEDGAREAQLDLTDRLAAAVGEEVRDPDLWLRPVVFAVRMREPDDAAEVIDALGGT